MQPFKRFAPVPLLAAIILVCSVAATGPVSSAAQSRTLPAQYRKSGQRMYLKKLQIHLKNIRPKAQQMLERQTRPSKAYGNRGAAQSRLHRAQMQQRYNRAGHVKPRMWNAGRQPTSAYQRSTYNRSIRLRSRTVQSAPPVRKPRAYNRSLSAYGR